MIHDEYAPNVQLTFSMSPETAHRLLTLYALIEGDSIDEWYWLNEGAELLSAWHFAGDQLIDKCAHRETWDGIPIVLGQLLASWQRANANWPQDESEPES